ncbi:unnamed protein product [Durusdinium trenchii]|uniref:Uncharacterized protein n=2 Tax=Durusdinium trenchii TaxID=1381693 RepID=A0ABP0PN19_9DINO
MELPSRRPWQVFTGAELPCSDGVQQRCFLLAGWDGERLPVAWVRGRELTPSFNLPLPSGSSDLRAMHLTSSGQLWLLLGTELMAWDLLRGEFIGRWQPDWQGFTPRLLCHGQRLLVAGTAGSTMGFARPRLLALEPRLELQSDAPPK